MGKMAKMRGMTRHADFFGEGGMPTGCMDDQPVAKVEAKLAEHLERTGLGPAQVVGAAASPQRVLDALTAHQGGFVRGASEAAINNVVEDLAELVRGLGEVETPLVDGSLPTSRPRSLMQLLLRRPRTGATPLLTTHRVEASNGNGACPTSLGGAHQGHVNEVLEVGRRGRELHLAIGSASASAAAVEGAASPARSGRRRSTIGALLSGQFSIYGGTQRPARKGTDDEFSLSGFFGVAREGSASNEETVNPVLVQKVQTRKPNQVSALARLQGHKLNAHSPGLPEVETYLSRCEGVELRDTTVRGSTPIPGTKEYKATKKEMLELMTRRQRAGVRCREQRTSYEGAAPGDQGRAQLAGHVHAFHELRTGARVRCDQHD